MDKAPYETTIDTEHLRYPTNLTAYLFDKTSLNLIIKKGIQHKLLIHYVWFKLWDALSKTL